MDSLFIEIWDDLENKVSHGIPINQAVNEVTDEYLRSKFRGMGRDWVFNQVRYVADNPRIANHSPTHWAHVQRYRTAEFDRKRNLPAKPLPKKGE